MSRLLLLIVVACAGCIVPERRYIIQQVTADGYPIQSYIGSARVSNGVATFTDPTTGLHHRWTNIAYKELPPTTEP